MSNPRHDVGFVGEQTIGFMLGEQGYFFVQGPSGAGGHGITTSGFDGVAFNPRTGDLMVLDNKSFARAGNVTSATAIDPAKNLQANLRRMIEHVRTHPNLAQMPHRAEILQRMEATERAVASWIVAGRPAGGLNLGRNVRLVVTNAMGNSTGVGGRLTQSGAVEFLDANAPTRIRVATEPRGVRVATESPRIRVATEPPRVRLASEPPRIRIADWSEVPHPEPSPHVRIRLDEAARAADRATGRAIAEAQEEFAEELAQAGAQEAEKRAARTLLKARLPETLGRTLGRVMTSRAAKAGLALVPFVGWTFNAKDAHAGVKDIIRGNVARGMCGIGVAAVDTMADFLHVGDLISGVGGTALSVAVQAGTTAAQVAIEMDRVRENMQRLQEEVTRTGQLPSDDRLEEEFDLDADAIKEIKATVGPELAALSRTADQPISPRTTGNGSATTPSPAPEAAISPKAAALLGAIGAPGSRRNWQEAVARSGLSPASANDAVLELEAKGWITVERFGADTLNIRSVTRVR